MQFLNGYFSQYEHCHPGICKANIRDPITKPAMSGFELKYIACLA